MPEQVQIEKHQDLVRSLLSAEAYPHPVSGLHLRQTHVSYLFFTGSRVYKVKKPVDMGFLDFTTLERREHFCRREVELNRRISPQVYLGVVPIVRQGEVFRVQGEGPPVEYAVCMRQLPEERALRQLLDRGDVNQRQIESVADVVAEFHRKADRGPEITQHGDLDAVRENVCENFQQTLPYIGPCLTRERFDELAAYSRAFLKVHADEFLRRAEEGRVRDGHGDLHADNVFLTDEDVQIIDCIEFNRRFRCLDVAEDLAFLVMDLDYHARPDLADAYVDRYVLKSGDSGLRKLLDFFKVYRAHVKAKVTSFRLDQLERDTGERREALSEARRYFRLAYSYVRRTWPSPACYGFMGLMGTGKTVLARELSRRRGLRYLASDETRKRLAGVPLDEHQYEEYGEGIYSPEHTDRTYRHMARWASTQLEAGRSVVLDASFSKHQYRRPVVEAARACGVRPLFIECHAPEEELVGRLRRRERQPEETVSDGRLELLRQQSADWEKMGEEEGVSWVRLDTAGTVQETVEELLERLYQQSL